MQRETGASTASPSRRIGIDAPQQRRTATVMKRASPRLIALLCCLPLAGGALTAAADAPGMRTIAQMAHDEGWDPEASLTSSGPPRMSRRVPRDFPLPDTCHDLQASDVAPTASVACTVEDAEAFYEVYFHNHDWRIDKRMKARGLIGYVACREGQCVNVSATDSEDSHQPSRITLTFYQEAPAAPSAEP